MTSINVIVLVTFLSCCSVTATTCKLNITVDPIKTDDNPKGCHSFATGFIRAVQRPPPYDKVQDLIDDIQNNEGKRASDLSWPIAKHEAGFIACLAIGVILVIVVPFFGFITCCARCCCNTCGSKRDQKDPSTMWCVIWTFFVLCCTALITAAFALFLQGSQQVMPNIPKMRDGVADQIHHVSEYVTSFEGESTCIGHGAARNLSTNLHKAVENIVNIIEDTVMEILPFQETLQLCDTVDDLVVVQGKIKSAADRVPEAASSFKATCDMFYDALSANITQWEQTEPITIAVPDFDGMKSNLHRLDGLTDVISTINDPLDGFIASENRSIDELRQKYTSAESEIHNKSSQASEDIHSGIDKAMNSAKAEIDKELRSINQSVSEVTQQLREAEGDVREELSDENLKKYDWIGHVLGVFVLPLGVILMFLVVFWICGPIGHDSKRQPYDRSFPSHAGGCFLLIVAYCMFVFSILITAITFVLFSAGYLSETLVCDPLFENPDPRYMQLISSALQNVVDTDLVTIDIENTINLCAKDEGIYTALNLSVLDEIKIPSIDIDPVKIDVTWALESIRNQVTQAFGIMKGYASVTNANKEKLEKKLNISSDLQEVQDFLAKLDPGKRPNLDVLKHDAASLQMQLSQLNADITELVAEVNRSLDTADLAIDEMNYIITELSTPLDLTNLTNVVIHNATATLTQTIDDAKFVISHQLGNCLPLYKIWVNAGDLVCKVTFMPVHEMWLGYGIAVFATLPTIIAAFVASRYYLKMDSKYYAKPVGGYL